MVVATKRVDVGCWSCTIRVLNSPKWPALKKKKKKGKSSSNQKWYQRNLSYHLIKPFASSLSGHHSVKQARHADNNCFIKNIIFVSLKTWGELQVPSLLVAQKQGECCALKTETPPKTMSTPPLTITTALQFSLIPLH